MGIELELKHVDQWSLERLLEAPAAVEAFFLAEPSEFSQAAVGGLAALGLPRTADQIRELATHDWRSAGLEHLEKAYPRDYERIRPHLKRLFAEWDEPALDLSKAWRRLHDALDECSKRGLGVTPDVLMGGTPIGHDLGYGPARYFVPAEVTALAARLPEPAALDPVVRDDWSNDLYRQVREYYVAAARRGRAMLLCFG